MKKARFWGFVLFIIISVYPAVTHSDDEEMGLHNQMLTVQLKGHEIVISITKCQLYLYEIWTDGSKTLTEEHVVATVKKTEIAPLGEGEIRAIQFNPSWYPTERTRKYFLEKKGIALPSIIPPGHKQNYMGPVKIVLSHKTKRGDVYRIHGCLDNSVLGTRATGGCVRMDNKKVVELAKKVKVGTKVLIEM